MIRALERLGLPRTRQKGSHAIMRRGSSGCVIPLHREKKRGTLAGLLRQAEVSVGEFIQAL
ncbi:MAG: type II toxin-antitoxin system HicA family toxin [Opitutales bacterium]